MLSFISHLMVLTPKHRNSLNKYLHNVDAYDSVSLPPSLSLCVYVFSRSLTLDRDGWIKWLRFHFESTIYIYCNIMLLFIAMKIFLFFSITWCVCRMCVCSHFSQYLTFNMLSLQPPILVFIVVVFAPGCLSFGSNGCFFCSLV